MKFDWKFYLGVLISFVFLYFALRKIDYYEMWGVFSNIRWHILIISLVVYYLTYLSRALRWRYLTLPIKEMPIRSLFSAIAIGFGANNMLPARIGELVRAYTLGKLEEVRASSVFATIVVERVFDGFSVVAMLIVVLLFVDFPEGYLKTKTTLRWAGLMMFIVMTSITIFLILLEKNRYRAISIVNFFIRPFSVRFKERVRGMVLSFADGLDFISRGRHLLAVIYYSILTWLLISFFYYLILLSCNFDLPFISAVFVTVALAFAVAIPAAPGYIGTFHAAARYALVFYGLTPEPATGIGIVMHAMNFFPAIVGGLLFLWIEKVSLSEVTHVSHEDIEVDENKGE